MVAPPVWTPGTVLGASDVNNWLQPMVAYKASDQSVTSSITLVNDSDLTLPVAVNAFYTFWLFLDYEGGTGGSSDLKLQFAVPAGAFLRYHMAYEVTTAVVGVNSTFTAATSIAGLRTQGAGNLCGTTMHGTLFTVGSPGNITLQWAQNTSSATSTIVHAQSCMVLQRIG